MSASALALTLNLALYGLLVLVHLYAERHPQSRWVHLLFTQQFGPRTDTRNMGAADLIRSSAIFLGWGVAFVGLFLANAYAGPPPSSASNLQLGINFAAALLAGTCFAGALYSLLRSTVAFWHARLQRGRADSGGIPHRGRQFPDPEP